MLNLAVSALLFERFAGSDEGDLTRVRAHLVREDTLHRLALSLGLPDVLRLSEGEARGGGAQRASILADALEAVIGATYLDGGYDAGPGAGAPPVRRADRQHRARELGQGRQDRTAGMAAGTPSAGAAYRIEATRGQAARADLRGECACPELDLAERGEGRSRRAAEQEAARRCSTLEGQRPARQRR